MNDETEGSFLELFGINALDLLKKAKLAIIRGFQAFIAGLKRLNIVQILIAMIITATGVYFAYIQFHDNTETMIWMFVLILLGIILGSWVWIRTTRRFFPRFIYLLAEQKYTRKLIAGGSFSYYEYKDPDKETVLKGFLGTIWNTDIYPNQPIGYLNDYYRVITGFLRDRSQSPSCLGRIGFNNPITRYSNNTHHLGT